MNLGRHTDNTYQRGGSSVPVTIHNVEEYIERLYDLIMGSGISEQIDAFRRGFDELFAFDDLKILSYEELVSLCGTAKEDWSFESKWLEEDLLYMVFITDMISQKHLRTPSRQITALQLTVLLSRICFLY